MPIQTIEDFEKQRETIHRNMLSSVSHDLKTPLASIIGSLEIHEKMKDKLSQDKKEALIATALQEAYRLDNFVTNILEMAKLENGMVTLQFTSVPLASLLKDCMIRLGHRLGDTHLDVRSSNDIFVDSDAALLSRAIMQVLDNAVKYGGVPGAIQIDYFADPATDMCILTIRDNGKGVPEGKQDFIFEKYTRFSKKDQQNAGTGLGLSISKEIMRLLKGSITVQNDPVTGGACFTFKIPLKK